MLIYVITDRRLRPDLSLNRLVESVAGSGADMIQIREKDLTAAALLGCARRASEVVPAGTRVFVNSRPDVAVAAGVTGVHLPASGLPPSDVAALWGGRLRIGVSTHNLDEAMEAQSAGADLITFGPVFETTSKRVYGPPAGVGRLSEVLSNVSTPVFAIGGINLSTLPRLTGLPIAGVAVISAVLLAGDMGQAVAGLRGGRG
ncbi:MAG TPA: thiamine phosphate synthase [Candidatus Polarisedimenticolia bacterium]|jgi:thiamine-phosphate pyrophosphorylase